MSNRVKVVSVEAVSPHNEGLYEAGKAMMVDSVNVGRDFCKSMIPVATGAIPVYVALLALAVGKEFRPDLRQGFVLTLAPVAYLLATVAFALGYFPTSSGFSLDIPSEIQQARAATIGRRKRYSTIGLALLVLGVALSIAGIFYGLSIKTTK
jgi:hypothetical protein